MNYSGWVMVFALTQIPVPHFQPMPLKRWVIADAKELVLGPEMLSGIPETSWPETSKLGDSIFRFNIVLEGDSLGAIIRNLYYFKKENRIGLGSDSISTSHSAVTASFSRLERLSAFISSEKLSLSRNHFLFIYGTGYSAIGNDGYFDLPLIPKDSYKLAYVAIPRKDIGHASGQDSATVFSATSAVETGTRVPVEIGDSIERVRLPEFYIRK